MKKAVIVILSVLIVLVGALDVMLVLPDIGFGKSVRRNVGKLISPIVKLTTIYDFDSAAKGSDKVLLTWIADTENTTDYVIFRKSEKPDGSYGKYNKIATLNSVRRSYCDSGLTQATRYKYRLYAYYGKTAHSMESETEVMTDIGKVSGFKCDSSPEDRINLKWNRNPHADIYALYRSEEGGEYKLLQKLPDSVTSYTDTDIDSGTLYTYKILAYRESGSFSSLSSENKINTISKLAPSLEMGLSDKKKNSIRISWNKVPHAEKYELFKTVGKKSELIKTLSKKTYKDRTYKDGDDCTYKVRALRILDDKVYRSDFTSIGTENYVDPVSELKAESYIGKCLIKWKHANDVDGYEVYLKNDGGYEKLGSTENDYFLTRKLPLGKYTFAVKSFDKVNGDKVYSYSQKAAVKNVDTAYGEEIGKTYVVVCTETQQLTMYVDGKKYLSTPVVTGMYNSQDTDPGCHTVITRGSPARLKGSANGHSWDVKVNYWLGFTSDGQGIHDATWRSNFGGTIYKGDGSNGCVNTPLDQVKKIYAKAFYGMQVIVY